MHAQGPQTNGISMRSSNLDKYKVTLSYLKSQVRLNVKHAHETGTPAAARSSDPDSCRVATGPKLGRFVGSHLCCGFVRFSFLSRTLTGSAFAREW